MKVKNFMCENCRNLEMCSGFKTIKKFSEDYSKNPLYPDITVDFCPTFAEEHMTDNVEDSEEYDESDYNPDRSRDEIIDSLEDVEI